MRSKAITIALLCIIILATGGGVYLYRQDPQVFLADEKDVAFQFRVAQSEVVGWNKGEMVWRMKVATIKEPQQENSRRRPSRALGEEVIMENITEGWFYDDGVAIFEFTVDHAQYHTRTEDLILFGFRMETPDGDWMETDKMIYEKEKETLHAPGPVWGVVEGADVRAGEMTVYLENMEIVLSGGVHMEFTLEEVL